MEHGFGVVIPVVVEGVMLSPGSREVAKVQELQRHCGVPTFFAQSRGEMCRSGRCVLGHLALKQVGLFYR